MARPTNTTPFTASLVSISLILFFLGFFASLALTLRTVLDYQKENLELLAVLVPGLNDERRASLEKELAAAPFTKSLRFVSAQEAYDAVVANDPTFARALEGANPFPSSLNLHLRAAYIRPDSVASIQQRLLAYPEITEVDYPIEFIARVDRNATLISQVAVAVGVLLIAIAFFLIVNTIKLAIYSKRLVIRTMQLIGATQRYIRRPFLRMGLLQGFIAGLIANVLLVGLLLLVHQFVLPLNPLLDSLALKVLYLALLAFGAGLGWLSSKRAVNKFLDKSLDQLI